MDDVAVVDERLLRVTAGAAGFAAAAARLVAAWLGLAFDDVLVLVEATGAVLTVSAVGLAAELGDDCTAGEASGVGVAGAVAAGGVAVVVVGSVGVGWAC